MRPCGIAMPCPRPVEPSFSRANRLSNTVERAICARSSKSAPTCSNRRFLLVASISSRIFDSGRSCAIWFTRARARGPTWPAGGAELYASRGFSPPRDRGRRRGRGGALDGNGSMAVPVALLLVLDHLPVELVGECVDGRVHIRLHAFGVELLAADMQVGRDLLSELVDCKHHVDVDDVIEMACNAFQLVDDVRPDRRGDVQMMAAKTEIHPALLSLSLLFWRAPQWLHRFAHVDGWNLQRFPVLRDRPPRDEDTLIAEEVGNPAVGQRRLGILGANELLDQRPDRRSGRRAPGIGRHVAAEEVLELVGPALREHVLLRRDARNRGLVQAEDLRDLAQHHRSHRHFAMLEEMTLAIDDGLRDAQNRLEALLHVADQPFL